MFKCKVLIPFVFLFVWSSIHMIGTFFSPERKCVDFVVISNKGEDQTFTVSLLFVCIKYWTLGQPVKSIVVIFTMFLYSKQNAHNFSIDKNLFISQFFGQIKFSLCLLLIKKKLSPQVSCCLASLSRVYVYAMALTWIVYLACSRVCWVGHFLRHDFLRYFLNKWGCIRSTP